MYTLKKLRPCEQLVRKELRRLLWEVIGTDSTAYHPVIDRFLTVDIETFRLTVIARAEKIGKAAVARSADVRQYHQWLGKLARESCGIGWAFGAGKAGVPRVTLPEGNRAERWLAAKCAEFGLSCARSWVTNPGQAVVT